jgi:hypothetical protein
MKWHTSNLAHPPRMAPLAWRKDRFQPRTTSVSQCRFVSAGPSADEPAGPGALPRAPGPFCQDAFHNLSATQCSGGAHARRKQ